MDKIYLYVLDTRKHVFSELLSSFNLSEEEIKSLDKYRVLEVKKERLVSLYFKNKYIGEYSLNEYGKPISDKLHFNISHSKGVVALLISENRDVGVDIEVLRSKDEDVIKFISNEEEYRYIKTEFDFLSVWTNKESLVKCLGTGLKSDIKKIPSLPLDGKKEYSNETFYSKVIRINDYIISMTCKGEEDFEYVLKTEDEL